MPTDERNPANPPHISVVIVAFGSSTTLQACVDALMRQTLVDYEAFIVDNGPGGDAAVGGLTGLDDRFEVLRPDTNLGFAGGNNLGASRARGRWLALLNPDAYAERDWLEVLVREAEAAGAVMAGSLQTWHGHDRKLDGAGDAYHVSGIAWRGMRGKSIVNMPPSGETFAPCAAAALYLRSEFEAVGGFDERFFAYHEDVDLAFRIRLRGGRALQVQDARVSHVASGEPGKASDLAVTLGTRNRIWTYVKNMPGWLVWGLAPLHVAAVIVSLARDARRGRAGAALKGIGQAVARIGEVWRERKTIQMSRRASVVDLLRAMTLSPLPLLRTASDIRPWRDTALEPDVVPGDVIDPRD